jgi:predicted nucleic-acid-binding protein
MRAVDTNVLVRLIARDDADQVAAAEAFTAQGAWVSHLVLVETSWVLSAVFDRTPTQVAAAMMMLLDHEKLVVQDPEVVMAALAHLGRRPKLGFSDCLILEIARSLGHSPLGTFDRALARLVGCKSL